jgi:hypothetical protein
MGFYFCEKCGKRVTDADLARGQGRDKQVKGVYCAACSDGTMTVSFDAITQADFLKENQKRRRGERHSTSTRLSAAKELRRPHGNSNARRSVAGTVVVVVVVAVFSAVLGLFFIGRSDPDPSRPPASKSTASASTVLPVSSSSPKTAPRSEARPVARQLAEIRTMITADLRDYAKVRQKLDDFSKSFADTPEAQDAKALLSEIEENYTKLAEKAFTDAVTAAKASAASGRFDEAESKFRSIEVRFGDGPWFESKGKAAVEEALADLAKQREAWELRNVAGTLEMARGKLAAGRLEEASKLIANRAKWPAESRTQAEGLAAEIERKLAEAAAAKKLAEEGEALLVGFDRLMIAGEYLEARDYARSKGAAGGKYGEVLRSGERLAGKIVGESAAVIEGARTQLGKKLYLKLTNDTEKGTLKAVTGVGMSFATPYLINNQEHERIIDLEWDELHADQRQAFARLGGVEIEPSEKAVAATYSALGSGDMTAARKALGAASDHPLAARLAKIIRERETQQAYESAMKRAREFLASKRWKDAVTECENALGLRPEDKSALELLATIRRLEPVKVELGAEADAYVRGGGNASKNFGTAETLNTKEGRNPAYDRKVYIRFDLSTLPASITSAKLRIYAVNAKPDTRSVKLVADDTWQETAITWDNAPEPTGSVLRTWQPEAGQSAELDITTAVQKELAGDKKVSLFIYATSTGGQHSGADFASREARTTDQRPVLIITK